MARDPFNLESRYAATRRRWVKEQLAAWRTENIPSGRPSLAEMAEAGRYSNATCLVCGGTFPGYNPIYPAKTRYVARYYFPKMVTRDGAEKKNSKKKNHCRDCLVNGMQQELEKAAAETSCPFDVHVRFEALEQFAGVWYDPFDNIVHAVDAGLPLNWGGVRHRSAMCTCGNPRC